MNQELKNQLQEHFQLYFPKDLLNEFEQKGCKSVEDVVNVINTNYKRRVYRYLLNDYQLIDNYGGVQFSGSVMIVNPEQSLYSNGFNKKFDSYHALGAIDALFKALKSELEKNIEIEHYGSSAITSTESGFSETVTSEAKVITIMGVRDVDTKEVYWGIGESSNALRSAVDSLLSAINRMEMLQDKVKF